MLMSLIDKSGFMLTLNTINKFVSPYDFREIRDGGSGDLHKHQSSVEILCTTVNIPKIIIFCHFMPTALFISVGHILR